MASIKGYFGSLFGEIVNTLTRQRWWRTRGKGSAIAHPSGTDSNGRCTSQGTLQARLHTRLSWDYTDSTETIMVGKFRLIIRNDGAVPARDISVEVDVGPWRGLGKIWYEGLRKHQMKIAQLGPNSRDSSLILDAWQCPRDKYCGPGGGYGWPYREYVIKITWIDQSGKPGFYTDTHNQNKH